MLIAVYLKIFNLKDFLSCQKLNKLLNVSLIKALVSLLDVTVTVTDRNFI